MTSRKLNHKRAVRSWHLCVARHAYICLCECECVPGCPFASLNVTMCACLWFWGQSEGCCHTCSRGSKTSTLPPAISLSGSNLPMSVCRPLCLSRWLALAVPPLALHQRSGPIPSFCDSSHQLWTSVNNWHSQHLCCSPQGRSPLETVQP